LPCAELERPDNPSHDQPQNNIPSNNRNTFYFKDYINIRRKKAAMHCLETIVHERTGIVDEMR